MSDAPLLGGIHRMTDLETADDFTKKHTPYIAVEPDGEAHRVTVEVGYWVSHPNTADHWIEWIELYANDLPIARFGFGAGVANPRVCVTVNVDPGTKLSAIESCNLHGLWMSAYVSV